VAAVTSEMIRPMLTSAVMRVALTLSLSVWLCLCLTGLTTLRAQRAEPAGERAFAVTHYDARLEPNLAARSISGSVILTLAPRGPNATTLAVNRGSLEIDSVMEQGAARPFQIEGSMVRITLPPREASGSRMVTVTYHGTPRNGLTFVPEREQIYTIFSTSQWMVAVDAPDARATFGLRLIVPRGWAVAASGREVSRQSLSPDTDISEWRQDVPVPTYTFGFAAGRFSVVSDASPGVALRYLSNGLSEADVRRVFGETRQMIAFFEERAGRPYPGLAYTQALVARTAGQEMASVSILSEAYGRAVLEDPTSVSLIAHELAHQWWGNMVTCREWTHFWLNEGFATFMAAAYREHRFGREAYEADVAVMRGRYEQVRDRGGDRPLVFPDWNRPSADDRTLVYQKGAYVLHQLRLALGDRLFWEGIRLYTTRHFGTAVSTADFQIAMEQATKRDLRVFFREWVVLN
jgi:aminopeptidase N